MKAFRTEYSHMTVEEWTRMPAKEVLDKSNFLRSEKE